MFIQKIFQVKSKNIFKKGFERSIKKWLVTQDDSYKGQISINKLWSEVFELLLKPLLLLVRVSTFYYKVVQSRNQSIYISALIKHIKEILTKKTIKSINCGYFALSVFIYYWRRKVIYIYKSYFKIKK
jgi:hypothetical protein